MRLQPHLQLVRGGAREEEGDPPGGLPPPPSPGPAPPPRASRALSRASRALRSLRGAAGALRVGCAPEVRAGAWPRQEKKRLKAERDAAEAKYTIAMLNGKPEKARAALRCAALNCAYLR